MNTLLFFIGAIILLFALIYIATKYFGLYTDINNNGIPDKIEKKIKDISTEAKDRASKVKVEIKDVGKALKQVSKQSNDVIKAATKKTGNRRGRKPKDSDK
jgi:F0F1-type ATP synthase membrane subunit b/b'